MIFSNMSCSPRYRCRVDFDISPTRYHYHFYSATSPFQQNFHYSTIHHIFKKNFLYFLQSSKILNGRCFTPSQKLDLQKNIFNQQEYADQAETGGPTNKTSHIFRWTIIIIAIIIIIVIIMIILIIMIIIIIMITITINKLKLVVQPTRPLFFSDEEESV